MQEKIFIPMDSMHMTCPIYRKTQRGFALLALILYLGALAMLCISSFGTYFVMQSTFSAGLDSLHSISDMARMCAENMAARVSRMPSIQSGLTFKLYGHRCVLQQITQLSPFEMRVNVVFHYFDHYIMWWAIIDSDGFIIRREKI